MVSEGERDVAKRVFVACSRTDCRWNEDGQCNAAEIFVDEGPTCRTFEPMAGAMPEVPTAPAALGAVPGGPAPMGGGGMSEALRQAIAARLGGGAPMGA